MKVLVLVLVLLPVLVLVRVLVPVLVPVRASGTQAGQTVDVDSLIDQAYDAAYNLDRETALRLAHKAVAAAPEASRAYRTVASILWLNILYVRGAVTVDHYMGGVTKKEKSRPPPPADLERDFKNALDRAIALAEAALEANPNGVRERFDVGAAYAIQASYAASVEGSMSAAFRSAKRAFDAQEDVLERDPARTDAGVVVGTYRYLVSALSLPSRVFAYIVGFGGGKDRGIAMLEMAAANPASEVDASSALLLIYSREGRHADAMAVAERLAAKFPRNRLFTLEAGAAAIRAGQAAHAEALLTVGLRQFGEDTRPKIPGERAIWYFKRGAARLALNHPADARADLDEALASGAPPWIEGRIHIELGKLHDLAGRREAALAEYATARRLCKQDDDAVGERQAAEYERKPFAFERKKGAPDLPDGWGMLRPAPQGAS